MIEIQKSKDRGSANHGWLRTMHSFSFGEYFNPEKMGFGPLLVLNEDYIEPSKGFPAHPHENMEIVTIVLEGAVEHKDSMGNHGIIKAGEVQTMSAGTGILHSEFNHSNKKKTHLLQIWILPKEKGLKPSYEQKKFILKKNKLCKIISGKKSDKALYIHQDATLSLGNFDKYKEISYKTKKGLYLFVIEGAVEISGKELIDGDAAAITEVKKINIKFKLKTNLLIIEV